MVVDLGVRLFEQRVRLVVLHCELSAAEVEDDALTLLAADGWKVHAILSGSDSRERATEWLVVAPELDDASIKVNERADDIADGPGVSISQVLLVPLLLFLL